VARKLKTYQTSLGFYDLAIAAPSMKAALEAWGAGSNLFHQGVAKESGDPDVVAATMSQPGVVLRRPVGSDGPFREHADLPTDLAGDGLKHRRRKTLAKSKEQVPRTTDDTATRKAALAFEREQRRREKQRRKEAAAAERKRQRRDRAIAKARVALERVKGSTIRGSRKSRPGATHSKRNRKQRMPVGRRRRTSWRGLYDARENRA
jgi:colicin import membrane protein